MEKKKFVLVGSLFFLFSFAAPAEEKFPQGEIVAEVFCSKNPEIRYALYLPSGYSDRQKWPVLFVFDPRAQAQRALERFRDAAEAYGYIVVGLLNAKNGPMEPIIAAARATWDDVRQRLAIDPRRVYSAGFSGGAEAAAMFFWMIGSPGAGVIACGSGLPPNVSPSLVKSVAYFAFVGVKDFLYAYMIGLEQALAQEQVVKRLAFFDGWHQWPPAALLGEAVAWQELQAMKRGLQERDGAFIEEQLRQRMTRAEEIEAAGNLPRARHEYETIGVDFADLLAVDVVRKKIERISGLKEYAKAVTLEKEAAEEEKEHTRRLEGIFSLIDRTPAADVSLDKTASILQIEKLNKTVAQAKNLFAGEMAQRILSRIVLLADRRGGAAMAGKDFRRGVLCYELAKAASCYHFLQADECFNLACAYALLQEKKQAMNNLELAVAKGFADAQLLRSEPSLELLRSSKDFAALLARLERKE